MRAEKKEEETESRQEKKTTKYCSQRSYIQITGNLASLEKYNILRGGGLPVFPLFSSVSWKQVDNAK